MAASIEGHGQVERVLVLASNPATSAQTGFASSEERDADVLVGQRIGR